MRASVVLFSPVLKARETDDGGCEDALNSHYAKNEMDLLRKTVKALADLCLANESSFSVHHTTST